MVKLFIILDGDLKRADWVLILSAQITQLNQTIVLDNEDIISYMQHLLNEKIRQMFIGW